MKRFSVFQKPSRGRWPRCALFFLAIASHLIFVLTPRIRGEELLLDLVPEALDRMEGTSDAVKANQFQDFIHAHPEVYQRTGMFQVDSELLGRYLHQIKPYLPIIRELDLETRKDLGPALADLHHLFPDFDPAKAKIELILSLFRFDGKVPHDDTGTLLIGLDGLAKFYGPNAPLRVLLTHELFHLYHFQVNPLPRDLDRLTLGRQVWQEGLATYVSQQLNPNAPLGSILLDPRLALEGPSYTVEVAREIAGKLESTDDADTAIYLLHTSSNVRPSRLGYLIGFDIARSVAKTMPLEAMARLRGQSLLKTMRQQLELLMQAPLRAGPGDTQRR
jgi:hypothetical protein